MAYNIKVKNNSASNVTWGSITITPSNTYELKVGDIANTGNAIITDFTQYSDLARLALDGDISILESDVTLDAQAGVSLIGRFYDDPYKTINYIITTIDKELLNLPNIDNTADADKPISTAMQNALDTKEDSLGNPTTSGYVLSSTNNGNRSWVEMASGGGGSSQMFTLEYNADWTVTNGGYLWAGGAHSDGSSSTVNNAYWPIPYNSNIVAISASCLSGTSNGTDVGFDVMVNGAKITTVEGFMFNNQGDYVILGTPISITAGDEVALRSGSSTWSLNHPRVTVFFEKA